jgi:hypothetical protein
MEIPSLRCGMTTKGKQRQGKGEIRGSFAPLRMTTKNKSNSKGNGNRNGNRNRRSPSGMTTRKATATTNTEILSCAQNDEVLGMDTEVSGVVVWGG